MSTYHEPCDVCGKDIEIDVNEFGGTMFSFSCHCDGWKRKSAFGEPGKPGIAEMSREAENDSRRSIERMRRIANETCNPMRRPWFWGWLRSLVSGESGRKGIR